MVKRSVNQHRIFSYCSPCWELAVRLLMDYNKAQNSLVLEARMLCCLIGTAERVYN